MFTNVWLLLQSSPKVQVQFCIFWGLIVSPILFKYFVLMSSSSFLLELKFPLGLLCCIVVESCRNQTHIVYFLWLAIWIYVGCDNQPFFFFFGLPLSVTLCVCIKATILYNNCIQHSQTKEKENVLKLFFLSFFLLFCPYLDKKGVFWMLSQTTLVCCFIYDCCFDFMNKISCWFDKYVI